MKDYNPLERPVFNDTQTLTVNFSFSLMQIMDVVREVGKDQIHAVRVELRYKCQAVPCTWSKSLLTALLVTYSYINVSCELGYNTVQ